MILLYSGLRIELAPSESVFGKNRFNLGGQVFSWLMFVQNMPILPVLLFVAPAP